jgi:hypothetical protein
LEIKLRDYFSPLKNKGELFDDDGRINNFIEQQPGCVIDDNRTRRQCFRKGYPVTSLKI